MIVGLEVRVGQEVLTGMHMVGTDPHAQAAIGVMTSVGIREVIHAIVEALQVTTRTTAVGAQALGVVRMVEEGGTVAGNHPAMSMTRLDEVENEAVKIVSAMIHVIAIETEAPAPTGMPLWATTIDNHPTAGEVRGAARGEVEEEEETRATADRAGRQHSEHPAAQLLDSLPLWITYLPPQTTSSPRTTSLGHVTAKTTALL